MFFVMNDNLHGGKWEYLFPIKLGLMACNNMINASTIGSDLLNLNLGFYHEMRSFDNKNFFKNSAWPGRSNAVSGSY